MTLFFRSILSIVFVVILATFVTGCDLIGDAWNSLLGFGENLPKRSTHVQSLWAVNQENGDPADCSTAVLAAAAVQAAQEFLVNNEEALQLQNELAAQGNNLEIQNAIGCIFLSPADLPDGLYAPSSDDEESTLIEIPAGTNAALYMAQTGEDTNAWAAVKETEDEGDRITLYEAVADNVNGLTTESRNFIVLNAEDHTELLNEVLDEIEAFNNGTGGTGDGNLQLFVQEANDPDLVWTNAQFVVDEDTEELMIVVPHQSSLVSGEGLGLGNLINNLRYTGLSLTARMKLAREVINDVRKWRLYRQADDPLSAAVVRQISRTSEYDKPFGLCKYRYVAPLVWNVRNLCEGSFTKFHEKAWKSNVVTQKNITTRNQLAQDMHLVDFTWDAQLESSVMLSGFSEVDTAKTQAWMEYSKESLQSTTDLNSDVVQSLEILNSLGSENLNQWLMTLDEAWCEGVFDSVYDELLLQGFDSVENALIIASGNQDSAFIKDLVKSYVEVFHTNIVLENTQATIPPFKYQSINREQYQFIEQDIDGPPIDIAGAMFAYVFEFLVYLITTDVSYATDPNLITQYLGNVLSAISDTYTNIANHPNFDTTTANEFFWTPVQIILTKLRDRVPAELHSVPFVGGALGCGIGCEFFNGFLGLMRWSGDSTANDVDQRVEKVLQYLDLLAKMTRSESIIPNDPFQNDWLPQGIVGPDGNPFDEEVHGDNIFIITRVIGEGTNGLGHGLTEHVDGEGDLIVISQIDNCEFCADPITYSQQASDVALWVENAIEVTKKTLSTYNSCEIIRCDRGLITYGFTNSNAQYTDAALSAVISVPTIRDSMIPIIFWRIVNGVVQFRCVGNSNKCAEIQDDAGKIACKQALGTINCNRELWDIDTGSNQGSSEDDPNQQANVVIAPLPTTIGSNSTFCLESLITC